MSKQHQNILRSTSVMSLGTVASRVLGFVRDVIFAQFFGTALGADVFVVAFRIPNLFRDILGEGAANSSFVPVMTEYKEKKPAELKDFLNATFAWAFLVLLGLTVVGIVLSPWLVRAIAPGFSADPGKLELAIALTQIMFPYLLFIGLTAFFSAIQFTYGSFMAPAFGPCLLNIILIVSTLVAVVWMKVPVYGLAIGVLVGGVAQFAFQWQPLKRHGIRLQWPTTLTNAGVRRIGTLLAPRILGTAVYQLNIFVDTICASLAFIVGPGGIAAIYFANRILLFPLGIFGVALSSASLPVLSQYALQDDKQEFRKTVAFSLQNIFFVMLPMTVFLCLLSEPIVRVIFQRGAFDQTSTVMTSSALLFFSLALVAYGQTRILVAAFHALQDTRTPVKSALVCLLVNIVLNIVLMFPMKLSGIALASTVSAFVNVITLTILLQKKVGSLDEYFKDFYRKTLLAAIGQGVAVWGFWLMLDQTSEILRLVVVTMIGLIVYWRLSVAFKLSHPDALASIFSRK